MFFNRNIAFSQSVEFFTGNNRAGIDLMWFRNFKNETKNINPFLFFSRNRGSFDYISSPSTFASTNAVSYNLKNGIGFVGVASIANSGFVYKSGIQFYKSNSNLMFFAWLVTDIKKNGNIDLFGLFRYKPVINEKWNGFGQIELFQFYKPDTEILSFTQRYRIGISYLWWVGGLMLDFNQSNQSNSLNTINSGVFLRYEF